ncbi:hypothetical protein Tco_0221768 [Tanacetum coccineum]
MTHRSSRRLKKVPIKFNDMIHELSNKDMSIMDMLDDDTLHAGENDKVQAWDNDASYEMSNGEERADQPVKADNALTDNDDVIDVCVSEKLVDNTVKEEKVPTIVNEDADEVVIFDEELFREGSEKWKYIVCGYFVESSMHVYEVKYNLRRMWGKHGHYKCTLSPRTEEEKEKTNDVANKEDGFKIGARNNNGKFMFKPKILTAPMDKGKQVNSDNQKGSGNVMRTPSRLEKVWNIRKSNVEELKRSANKYDVLSEVNVENARKSNEELMIDRRLIVDEFVKKKLQPSISDTKDWSYDMINYFKYTWEAMERRMNEKSDEEVVMENTDVVQSIIANEVIGKESDLGMETISDKIKLYVNCDYASNNGIERRAHGIFLPYLVSDHSAGLLIFPYGLPKKLKSFRFANYTADKHEFLETIEKAKFLKASLQMAQNEVDKDPFNVEKKGGNLFAFLRNIQKKHKNRVESICDENGVRYWGADVAKQILNLSKEDAGAMIVEVSNKEIKEAMFEIDSSEVSRPDGYTSFFFKKAWDLIRKDDLYDARLADDAKDAYLIHNGIWIWHDEWIEYCSELHQIPIPNLDDNVKDKVCWVNCDLKELNYSTKLAWLSLRDNGPKVQWDHVDRIMKWQHGVNLQFPLCLNYEDSHNHLFFQCNYATKVWDRIKVKGKMQNASNSMYTVERNKRIFQNEKRIVEELSKGIEENIESMLKSLTVKKSTVVVSVSKE